MKRAAIYTRVSTLDQHPETQLLELRAMAKQRGYELVSEFCDHGVSGTRAKRPALDQLLLAARSAKLDVVMVWACDRMARSTRHFLEVLDELNHLNVEFVSLRENIDTGGPLGRAMITIIGAIAELERSLIIERVRAGMRRAKLEGQRIGRPRIRVDEQQIRRDRARGMSLAEIAKAHSISRTSVRRVLAGSAPKGVTHTPPQLNENRRPESAA
jgi:DNA invertase Pin-like site-specific DNA recombinase